MKILMPFLVLSLASCAKLSSTQSSAPGEAGNATYVELYSSTLESKCLSCHSSSSPAGGVDVSTYDNLVNSASLVSGDPESSTFYTQVLSGQMPQGQPALTYDEIENIRLWIANGLPEGSSTPPPVVAPTFTQMNQEILQPLCSSCHSGATPSGSYSVVNYANVMSRVTASTPLSSPLYTRVADDSMPPGGQLNATQKAMIESWINAGALDN